MRAAFIAFVIFLAPSLALAQICPAPAAQARKLVLVTPDNMSSTTATVQRFVRSSLNARWRAESGPVTALIGRAGTGWSHVYRSFAARGEPIKVEGDKRLPAGFFQIGRSFGFGQSSLPDYLRIAEGTTCVDDLRSPAYNTITSRAEIGWQVHGENMWRVPEYRRGLLVEYPTNRQARAGSCIFFHIRKAGAAGTAGCIALPEPVVEDLQHFVQGGAVVAVVPRQALSRFEGCLPDPAR